MAGSNQMTATGERKAFGTTLLLRLLVCAIVLGILAASITLTTTLRSEVNGLAIPFDTDEADHANPGLDLYHAIQRGEAAGVVEAISRQAFYPPLNSIFVAASYAKTGPGLATSRLPSTWFHLLAVVGVFAVCWMLLSRVYPRESWWIPVLGSCLAAALLLTCPALLGGASLAMLEPLAILTVVLTLLVVAWQEQVRSSSGAILTGVTLLLVWFAKYNFAAMVVPAVAGALWLGRYPPRLPRITFGILAAGLFMWMIIADPYVIWRFFVGHGSDTRFLTAENFFFYPGALVSDFALSPQIALLSYALALVGAVRYRSSDTVRVAVLVTLITLLIYFISPVNEARYISPAVVCLFLMAGLGFAALIESLNRWLLPAMLPLCLLIFLAFFTLGIKTVELNARLPGMVQDYLEGHPDLYRLQDFIADNVDSRAPLLACGLHDQFSREAVIWKLMAESDDHAAYTDIRVDPYPYTDFLLNRLRDRKRNVPAPWLDSSFPKEPVGEIIKQGYYGYAVTIVDTRWSSAQLNFVDQCHEALLPYPVSSLELGYWTASVFRLKS